MRLSLQKQNGSPTLPVATEDKVDSSAVSGSDLIVLRDDSKPYTGVFVRPPDPLYSDYRYQPGTSCVHLETYPC